MIRYGLLSANIIALGAVISFVSLTSHNNSKSAVVYAVSNAEDSEDAANPIDHLTSYDIAANVAKTVGLVEEKPIANQAQTAKVSLATSTTSDTNVVAKPQIVATPLKSKKDIKLYTVQAGEDVPTVAQKFGVTSDSIKWSNNLSSNAINAGTKLTIPPVSGIVYTVANGDTVQSLATKFKASAEQITAYNDAEIDGLKVGEKIIIPGGQVVQTVTRSSGSSSVFLATVYAGNGYDYGYCTWYAFNERARMGKPVGSNWGNATTWAAYARAAGFTVDHTPTVGAVQQNGGGLGHVAVVTAVNDDGSWTVSEMNFRGWGVVSSRTLSAGQAGTYNFIH